MVIIIINKNIINKFPCVIYVADQWNYQTLYVNDSIQDIYGYTALEWLAIPHLWLKSNHEDAKSRELREIEVIKAHGAGDVEYGIG